MFVLATVPQLPLALFLANLLNRRLRGRTLFRLARDPADVDLVAAVAIVFTQLFSRDFGIVNWVLAFVGVPPDRVAGGPSGRPGRLSRLMVNWRWTGYNALIYLAAMQAIPRDLYEAAALDGAGALEAVHARSPCRCCARRSCSRSSSPPSAAFQLFTEPLLFNSGSSNYQGGSLRQSQTVAMHLWENAFVHFDFGYASAVAWVLFLIILLASALNFLAVRRLGGKD